MNVRLLLLVSWFGIRAIYAQSTAAEQLKAATYFKEAREASADQTLWPTMLYGPMLLVDPQSRMAWANSPDSSGILKLQGDIYTGQLPSDVLIANTAITWQKQRWSVILWPLPENRQERLSLLLHESFHRIQGSLGLPANDPTIDHLGTMIGRLYFLLELQALKAALTKPVDQRQTDLTNALLFRAKRELLFPKTFPNERILEMNEGLAEYTGVMLGRPKDSLVTYLIDQVNQAANRRSLIRSSAYLTGPLYGYLLAQKDPQWTAAVKPKGSLASLLAQVYQLSQPPKLTSTALANAVAAYSGQALIESERRKETDRQKVVGHYIDLFTRQPVLIFELVKMNINFNPNNLLDLGAYGTVYPTAELKDEWGQLVVEAQGMLLKDWKRVSLPLASVPRLTGENLQGKGWRLKVTKGWQVRKIDALHYILVLSE